MLSSHQYVLTKSDRRTGNHLFMEPTTSTTSKLQMIQQDEQFRVSREVETLSRSMVTKTELSVESRMGEKAFEPGADRLNAVL